MRVLFLCTGNSARSQLAEALLRRRLDDLAADGTHVASAGTDPQGVNPLTIAVLAEVEIDASDAVSEHLDRYIDEPWDYVITVCDRAAESCPMFPGAAEQMHWSTVDPADATGDREARLSAFRGARDTLDARIQRLLERQRIAGGDG
ncbi:MAG TPA: arsenate reductase ArsC [Dehalococcoidia bacterium]|nr:arsenate reductase ArsC [Dehalococcoidia bacterium]